MRVQLYEGGVLADPRDLKIEQLTEVLYYIQAWMRVKIAFRDFEEARDKAEKMKVKP